MRLGRIYGVAVIGIGLAASAFVAMPQTASAAACTVGLGCTFTATLFTGTEPPPGYLDIDVTHAPGFVTSSFSGGGLTITGVGGTSSGAPFSSSGEYVGSISS